MISIQYLAFFLSLPSSFFRFLNAGLGWYEDDDDDDDGDDEDDDVGRGRGGKRKPGRVRE